MTQNTYKKMQKKEIHLKRFFKVIKEKEVWSLTDLKERINILLPRNIEISEVSLAILINNQQTYKVFKCLAENKENQSKKGIHYIFKKTL